MKIDWKELTVSMTPSFMYEGDWLFKAQLKCLSEQTNKNFNVLVVDSHYSKRKEYMPQLAEHYGLSIIHIPYYPNLEVAKKLDCQIFNTPYLFSESPRIVRYSCWRFVRPNFTDICLNSKGNVDFYFHSVEPSTIDGYNPLTAHNSDVWDFGSDVVHWDKMPKFGEKGCTWSKESEVDAPPTLFPKNAYGNYMVMREDWLNINGCDEILGSATHFEDMDFTLRARNLGLQCERKSNVLYRLHHLYGGFEGRSNIPADFKFKELCDGCKSAWGCIEPNRYDLKRRAEIGEIKLFEDKWICKTCRLSGASYSADAGEYTNGLEWSGKIKASVNAEFKLGRNLWALTKDMDGKDMEEKLEIFKNSWHKEKYFHL